MIRKILTAALVVIAILTIIAVGMWGSIKIASLIPNAFSSLASVGANSAGKTAVSSGSEKITLSVPALTVNTRSTFPLSFTHEKKTTDGSYTFRYDCANGLFFVSPTPPSGAPATVYCNTPFNFLSSNNTIILTPVLETSTPVDVTVYIDFTPNGATKPTMSGSLKITVVNNGGFTPSATSTPSATTPKAPVSTTPSNMIKTPNTSQTGTTYYPVNTVRTSDPNGSTDLRVTIIEAGTVDRGTGTFIPSSTPSRSQKVGVRFAIENIGTKTSPQFDFSAVLPSYAQSNFQGPLVQELAPGQKVEFMMGFDSFSTQNGGVVTITVDPSSRIAESDKNNNTARYTITTTP